jgi:Tfp pilus assembly protein PilE
MIKALSRTALTLALAATALPAQQAPVAAPAGPSPLVTLRSTLRQLVTYQEKYYADHSSYASSLDALKSSGFTVPAKVSMTLLEAKPNAWSASAAHADVPGATCVDWVGRPGEVTAPKTALDGRNGREGEPTCDAAMAVVENALIAEAKSALRNLITLEEKYFADHGTYTTDLSALGLYPAPKGTRPPFMVQVIAAGGRGWSGITDLRRLNKSCVIYVGSVDELPAIPRTIRDRLLPTGEGEPTCEKP